MSTPQNPTRVSIPVIDYTPAEIHKGTNDEWRIVFYVINPVLQKLVRKRIRIKKVKNQTERLKYAKRMCAEINSKLERGWNPIIEQEAPKSFAPLKKVFEAYVNNMEREVKSGSLRPDTFRSYKSFIQNIIHFIDLKFTKDLYSINFDRHFVATFLDWVYFEKNNSPRTHNNYLLFLRTLANYLIQRGYMSKNPCDGILAKKINKKVREVIPLTTRNHIKTYLEHNNPAFLTLCLTTYYCFIRRTEICKLKVKDVHLHKGYIIINSENSKNRKTEPVTIPDAFLPALSTHLAKASNSDYLFSDSDFAPGREPLNPKRISDQWSKMRKELKFSNTYQFYSLKDTGITELLNTGIPAIKVRDQARHHDLKITESYTDRNTTADKAVQKSVVTF